MKSCNPVKNPIMLGFKLVKDEGGTNIDATVYKQMVGSLMYLIAFRPDLVYLVSLISRFMQANWIASISSENDSLILKGHF